MGKGENGINFEQSERKIDQREYYSSEFRIAARPQNTFLPGSGKYVGQAKWKDVKTDLELVQIPY